MTYSAERRFKRLQNRTSDYIGPMPGIRKVNLRSIKAKPISAANQHQNRTDPRPMKLKGTNVYFPR